MKTFTVEKLRKYSCASTGGIVLVALNGKVYDVTGDRELFGTAGPVATYSGHDATRAMATMSMNCVKDEPDDLQDLTEQQWQSVQNWENRFQEKYECVGVLVK